MRKSALMVYGFGFTIIIYLILSGIGVKRIDIGQLLSIWFYPQQPTPNYSPRPSLPNDNPSPQQQSESFEEVIEKTNIFIECLNKQGTGCMYNQ